MMSTKRELQSLHRKTVFLENELAKTNKRLREHTELHYRYVKSEELTQIYNRTSDILTLEIEGKKLKLKEVLEALLEYLELNVTEVERHLRVSTKTENPETEYEEWI